LEFDRALGASTNQKMPMTAAAIVFQHFSVCVVIDCLEMQSKF
jgi:hypothetical protein